MRSISFEVDLWKPHFVDLSEDLTMAYSYGSYTFSGINLDGQTISSTGLFHTVWKSNKTEVGDSSMIEPVSLNFH